MEFTSFSLFSIYVRIGAGQAHIYALMFCWYSTRMGECSSWKYLLYNCTWAHGFRVFVATVCEERSCVSTSTPLMYCWYSTGLGEVSIWKYFFVDRTIFSRLLTCTGNLGC